MKKLLIVLLTICMSSAAFAVKPTPKPDLEKQIADLQTQVGVLSDQVVDLQIGVAALEVQQGDLSVQVAELQTGVAEIPALFAEQYVPFMVRTGQVTCASSGELDWDHLIIEGSGTTGDFLVTSVAFGRPGGTTQSILSSSVIRVGNICADHDMTANCLSIGTMDFASTSDPEGFELLGAPTGDGGSLPRQIAASSAGPDDIVINIVCDADGDDIRFGPDSIVVSGWKQKGETVSVSYVEENPL